MLRKLVLTARRLVDSFTLHDRPGSSASLSRGLAGDSWPTAGRYLERDRPHRPMESRGKQPALAGSLWRPIGSHRHGESSLSPESLRTRRKPAGARYGAGHGDRPRRLGIQGEPLPERRPAASHWLGFACRRSRNRQHLCANRRRPGDRAEPSGSPAMDPIAGRGVGRVHDSWRSNDVSPGRRDLVIVSAAISSWGTSNNRAHRLVALDKRSGDIVYVANPGGRPYDTAYASPMIATINGMRQLIVGLGDGAIHSIKPQTGQKLWSFVAAKRAINTGVVVKGNSVIVSHGDENLETSPRPNSE